MKPKGSVQRETAVSTAERGTHDLSGRQAPGPDHTTYIGVDIGGTMIKALAFGEDGTTLGSKTLPTQDDGTGGWMERVREAVQSLVQRCPPPLHLGLAAPGLASPDGTCIATMPGRLPGLEGLNWQQWLNWESPVPVFNDAQAALLGEIWLGAAKGASNVFLLTLGTGVGGAAMVDGRVLRGRLGRAGHLGHVSLNPEGPPDIANTPGSLEDAIGDHSLSARSGGRFASTRDLVEAYRRGVPEAADIWLRSVRALGAAIASFINVLDPEIVVVGGGIAEANESLFEPLQECVDRFEWRPGGTRARIVKAALGGNAGATGAAYGAKVASSRGLDLAVTAA